MSRLSIRPRPLDIHKRLPVVKSSNEFEDDEAPATNSTRNLYHYRLQVENDNEVHQTPPTRKSSREIPTPKCSIVDTYEEDYGRTFMQSTSYIRRRGARAEIGEFVEYDLDNEDEDWLEEFNKERKALTPEKFEALLFKLEVMDHKARERAGLVNPTFGSPVPVLIQLDSAAEALQYLSVRLAVFQSVYNYWRAKREQWQKPILRRLQPPPPPSDTNPYNVFRPREKAHRLHTRRMQRRENNVQSFEKLRQVRRSLDQAKKVLEALIKREEKKREVIECEVNLQQLQMEYMMAGDGMEFPSLQEASCQFASSNEDYIDSDDTANGYPQTGHSSPHMQYAESKLVRIPTFRIKRKLKSSPLYSGWIQKDSDDPVLLFMKPLDMDKLAAVGIVHPPDPPAENGSAEPPYRFHGRIGRGGRIIFDRCNPLLRGTESTHFVAPSSRPSPPNG